MIARDRRQPHLCPERHEVLIDRLPDCVPAAQAAELTLLINVHRLAERHRCGGGFSEGAGSLLVRTRIAPLPDQTAQPACFFARLFESDLTDSSDRIATPL